MKQGFSNWSKKDFYAFVRMCETYGRQNFAKIAEGLPSKSVDEVREYS